MNGFTQRAKSILGRIPRTSGGDDAPTQSTASRKDSATGPQNADPGKPRDFRSVQGQIDIPVNDATPDQVESAACQEKGQFLARQDRWDDLSDMIAEADEARAATTSGTPVAELLAYGARSDVVRAAEHSLLHGLPAKGSDFFSGIEALEMVLQDEPDDYPLALVVAHMHIDVGWAWRGAGSTDHNSEINRDAFEAHFDRARDILMPFCPLELDSPALAAARCALLPSDPNPQRTLVKNFEDLIGLDATNPRHMRIMGKFLLPRWFGDYQKLDLEARRIAAQTFETWGAGGYAWVWFDALLIDPLGFAAVEIDYFLDGIRDILARETDQHVANLLAAHLFRSWHIAREQYHESGLRPDLAPSIRRSFETVVTERLREVHPLVWGHAEFGFENNARVTSLERLARKGREIALNAVALPFAGGLQAGKTVHFDENGVYIA
ncbi:hypothetical protein [Shimia biformata]|uniref:hypothetical protein n=1 Tax=Shimia biformata TaxID=1294299 RepID=UPI00194F964E|nr:hypothetical protein [Shimia biformata]